MRRTLLLFSLLALVAAVPVLVAQSTTEPAAGLSLLATAGIGFAASFVWGGAKKGIAFANAKVFGLDAGAVNFLKPVQPFVVAGLSIALPLLGNKLGITDLPPADVVASAPFASLIGVVAREAARRVFPGTPPFVPGS